MHKIKFENLFLGVA